MLELDWPAWPAVSVLRPRKKTLRKKPDDDPHRHSAFAAAVRPDGFVAERKRRDAAKREAAKRREAAVEMQSAMSAFVSAETLVSNLVSTAVVSKIYDVSEIYDSPRAPAQRRAGDAPVKASPQKAVPVTTAAPKPAPKAAAKHARDGSDESRSGKRQTLQQRFARFLADDEGEDEDSFVGLKRSAADAVEFSAEMSLRTQKVFHASAQLGIETGAAHGDRLTSTLAAPFDANVLCDAAADFGDDRSTVLQGSRVTTSALRAEAVARAAEWERLRAYDASARGDFGEAYHRFGRSAKLAQEAASADVRDLDALLDFGTVRLAVPFGTLRLADAQVGGTFVYSDGALQAQRVVFRACKRHLDAMAHRATLLNATARGFGLRLRLRPKSHRAAPTPLQRLVRNWLRRRKKAATKVQAWARCQVARLAHSRIRADLRYRRALAKSGWRLRRWRSTAQLQKRARAANMVQSAWRRWSKRLFASRLVQDRHTAAATLIQASTRRIFASPEDRSACIRARHAALLKAEDLLILGSIYATLFRRPESQPGYALTAPSPNSAEARLLQWINAKAGVLMLVAAPTAVLTFGHVPKRFKGKLVRAALRGPAATYTFEESHGAESPSGARLPCLSRPAACFRASTRLDASHVQRSLRSASHLARSALLHARLAARPRLECPRCLAAFCSEADYENHFHDQKCGGFLANPFGSLLFAKRSDAARMRAVERRLRRWFGDQEALAHAARSARCAAWRCAGDGGVAKRVARSIRCAISRAISPSSSDVDIFNAALVLVTVDDAATVAHVSGVLTALLSRASGPLCGAPGSVEMQRGEALLSRVFGQTATWTAAEPATTAGGTDGAASAAEPGAAPDSASDPAALLATAFLARRAQAADLREMGLSPRRIFRRSFAELLAQDLVGTTAAFSAQLAECRLQRGRDAAAGAQDDDDDELASLNLSHLSASASNKRFVRLRRAAEACEKLMLRYDAPTAVDPRKRKPAPKIKRPATGRVAPNDGVYDGGGGDDGGAPLAGAAAFAASALAQEAAPAPAVGPAPAHAAARALFSAAASAPAPAAAVGEAASSRLLSESRLEDSLGASQSDSCALETAHSACTAPSTASTATVAEALAPPRHCAVSAGAWRSVAGRRALVRSEVAKARLRCTHPHRDVDAFAALLRPVAHLSTGALGAEAPLYVFSVLDVFSAKERRETRCAFSRLCDFFKSVNLPAAADLCDERAVKAAYLELEAITAFACASAKRDAARGAAAGARLAWEAAYLRHKAADLSDGARAGGAAGGAGDGSPATAESAAGPAATAGPTAPAWRAALSPASRAALAQAAYAVSVFEFQGSNSSLYFLVDVFQKWLSKGDDARRLADGLARIQLQKDVHTFCANDVVNFLSESADDAVQKRLAKGWIQSGCAAWASRDAALRKDASARVAAQNRDRAARAVRAIFDYEMRSRRL